jgi:hypothetical protein
MLTMKTFEGTIVTPGYDIDIDQIEVAPDGDFIAFYDGFGGPDDEDYPAFVKFDSKTGTQKMAYWYNVTTPSQGTIGYVDKDGNIWFTGIDG